MRIHIPAKALISLVLTGLILFLPGCARGESENTGQIALIIDQTTICERDNIIRGAQAAANEKDLSLAIYSVEEAKTDAVEAAIQHAVDAQAHFLLLALSEKYALDVDRYGLPYITIGTDFPSEAQVLHIDSNDVTVGDSIAKQVVRELGLQKTVILIAGTEEYGPDERLESGLRLGLGYAGYTFADRLVADASLPLNLYRSLSQNEAVQSVVCLTAESTVIAARLLNGQDLDQIVLVGTGLDHETIDWLDLGIIDGLVLYNTYSQGYYAALYGGMSISGADQIPSRKTAATYVVNSETILTKEIESYVFSTINLCQSAVEGGAAR